MRQKILWLVVVIATIPGLWTITDSSGAHQRKWPEKQTVTGVIPIKRVLPEVRNAYRIKSDQAGNIYVLEREDHSIAVYDHQLKFVRRIGRIGNGPGEFYNIRDFAIGRQGELYIADAGNSRIQVLDSKGRFLRQFRFFAPSSVAVLSGGQILVVGQADDQPIRVFSPEGKYIKTIGTPVDLGLKNRELNAFLNQGRVLVDRNDNIYYMFESLLNPTVRKYSPEGKLLMEIHPEGTEMTKIRSRAEAKLANTIKEGSLSAEGVLNAIEIDSAGNIWIAPAGPIVYVYSAQGKKLAEYRWREKTSGWDWGALGLTIRGSKGYLVNHFVLSFTVPKIGRD